MEIHHPIIPQMTGVDWINYISPSADTERRMCCSRVCKVRRYAGFPKRSKDSPIKRPGMRRTCGQMTILCNLDIDTEMICI